MYITSSRSLALIQLHGSLKIIFGVNPISWFLALFNYKLNKMLYIYIYITSSRSLALIQLHGSLSLVISAFFFRWKLKYKTFVKQKRSKIYQSLESYEFFFNKLFNKKRNLKLPVTVRYNLALNARVWSHFCHQQFDTLPVDWLEWAPPNSSILYIQLTRLSSKNIYKYIFVCYTNLNAFFYLVYWFI